MAPSAEIALHNGTASDRANRRIFVQIPAYRDPELSPTLHDLFSKARNPEALRVAVLWQRAPDDRVEREVLRRKNLEIIDVSYRDSKGCNWARNVLQRLWKGEAYTLILDSHHQFAKNWDQKLINHTRRSFSKVSRGPSSRLTYLLTTLLLSRTVERTNR